MKTGLNKLAILQTITVIILGIDQMHRYAIKTAAPVSTTKGLKPIYPILKYVRSARRHRDRRSNIYGANR